MLLPTHEAKLFCELHSSLMFFVNERLQVVPGIDTPRQLAVLPAETRWKVRNAWLAEPNLIELFVDANPFDLADEELTIVAQWRYRVAGKFFIVRHLRRYTIFLTEGPTAYGVVAITDSFENLLRRPLPVLVETVLLPFKDKIVYEGLISPYRFSFGPGNRRTLEETYKAARDRMGIVTSLPVPAQLPGAPQAATARVRKSTPAAKDDERDVLQAVVRMIDEFSQTHLNEEYSALARKMAQKLARKRPSPMLKGQPNTWAAAILRTIGWANFLDDPEQSPHLKLKVIDQALGTSESTTQQKSKLIRQWFKIQPFGPEWTLPSLVDDNPLTWMIEVDGLIMDIRHCPREIQVMAHAKGLIPYIPADEVDVQSKKSDVE